MYSDNEDFRRFFIPDLGDDALVDLHPELFCPFNTINTELAVLGVERPTDKIKWTKAIGDLNEDTFIEIMKHLPLVDLLRCSQVHLAWRQRIFGTPSLWKSLSINGTTSFPEEKVRFWANRQGNDDRSLRELMLEGYVNPKELMDSLAEADITKELQIFRANGVQNTPFFEAINVWQIACANFTSLSTISLRFESVVNFRQDLKSVLHPFPNLEELELVGVGQHVTLDLWCRQPSATKPSLAHMSLRRLHLVNVLFFHHDNLHKPSSSRVSIPTLEQVFIKQLPWVTTPPGRLAFCPPIDWAHLPNLRTLHADFPGSYRQILSIDPNRLPDFPSLRSLAVFEQRQSGPSLDRAMPIQRIRAPVLQILELNGIDPRQTIEFISLTAPHCQILESLKLHDVRLNEVSQRLETVLGCIQRLKHLDVSQSGFSDAGVVALFGHTSELVSLDVSNCQKITGKPLACLVKLAKERADSQGGTDGLKEARMVGCTGIECEFAVWIKEHVETVFGPKRDDRSLPKPL